jgi:hypothetical protein
MNLSQLISVFAILAEQITDDVPGKERCLGSSAGKHSNVRTQPFSSCQYDSNRPCGSFSP